MLEALLPEIFICKLCLLNMWLYRFVLEHNCVITILYLNISCLTFAMVLCYTVDIGYSDILDIVILLSLV